MLPKWLLPDALPEMVIKGKRQHAPMIDARAIAITTYNAKRRSEAQLRRAEEDRIAAASTAARARWDKA